MPSWLLKRYEEGYTLINDKRALQFATFYNVDPNVFYEDTLFYNTAIVTTGDASPKKKSNFIDKFNKFLSNIKVFYALLATFVLSVAGLGVSLYYYVESNDHPYTFLTTEVTTVYNDIIERGDDPSTVHLLYQIILATDFRQLDYYSTETEKFSIAVPEGVQYYGNVYYEYNRYFDDGTEEGGFERFRLFISPGTPGSFMYINSNMSILLEEPNGSYVNGELFFMKDSLTEEEQNSVREIFPAFSARAEEYLASVGINETFVEFTNIFQSKANRIADIVQVSLTTTYLTALLSLGLLSLLIYSGLKIYSKKKRLKLEIFEEEENLDEFEGIPTENRPTPKNRRSFLFLKEGYFKVILLIGLLVGTSTVLVRFLGLVLPELMLFDSDGYTNFKDVASVVLYLALFAIFFVKVDSMVNRKNILLGIYITLFYGFAFYLIEALLYRILSTSTLIGMLITGFFPGNIFLGMASILSFAYFLLFLPKWVNKPWKQVLFRLGTLLPIGYLVASIVVSYLNEYSEITVSSYTLFLLQTKSIEVCLFCIASIVFLAIYRYISYKIYGREGADKMIKGTVYYTTRNLFLCLIIIVFTILGWCISDTYIGFKSLNLENDRYLCCLLPFFLLYQPRIPKSNVKEDQLFNIGYGGMYVLPYVACVIILLCV